MKIKTKVINKLCNNCIKSSKLLKYVPHYINNEKGELVKGTRVYRECIECKDNKLKQIIFNTIKDTISDFYYYDRKEDEELKVGDIEKAISEGKISMDEIVQYFENELRS